MNYKARFNSIPPNKGQIISRYYYLTLVLFLGSIFCVFSQHAVRNNVSGVHAIEETDPIIIIDIDMIKEKVIGRDVQFIDIRTPKEYNAGYIDDAINISIAEREQFISAFQKLDKEKPVYIYCYSGWRSHRTAKLLVTLGFNKIYDFKGGYKAWSGHIKR